MNYFEKELSQMVLKSLGLSGLYKRLKVHELVSVTRHFDFEKRLKYLYHMLGYDGMWVSVPSETIASLPFPAFNIPSEGMSHLALIEKKTEDDYITYQIGNLKIGQRVTSEYFDEAENIFFILEKQPSYYIYGETSSLRFRLSEREAFLIQFVGFGAAAFWITKSVVVTLGLEIALLGVLLFASIIQNHFMGKENIVFKICQGKTSCDKILRYKFGNSRFFDFKLLGLVYFISLLLVYVATMFGLMELTGSLLLPLLLIGLTGVVISLLVQVFIIRSFCKICLLTSMLIILHTLLISRDNIGSHFEWHEIGYSLFYISIAGIIADIYYQYMEKAASQKQLESTLLYFKSEYKIFRGLVELGDTIQTVEKFGPVHFVFGNNNADICLEMVISLKCPYCHQALCEMLKVVDKSDKYTLKIWFSEKKQSKLREILFFNTLFENRQHYDIYNFYKDVSQWYLNSDNAPITSVDQRNHLLKGIEVTPLIIIDNHIVPNFYKYEELNYLLSNA